MIDETVIFILCFALWLMIELFPEILEKDKEN